MKNTTALHASLALAALLMTQADVSATGVVNLRCEYRETPLGIDVVKPRLSWQVASPQSASSNLQSQITRSVVQTAYQVLVASTPELLAQDQGDLWDSGKVNSDQSIQVEYRGKPLESRTRCWWKVRVWSSSSLTSDSCLLTPFSWSSPAFWSMGLLKPADNRGAKATDVYTFKGQGEEVWNPVFKGQGFRRVQVTGFPGTPTKENFAGLVIHTDAEPAGEFSCSNELVNRIHQARCGRRCDLGQRPSRFTLWPDHQPQAEGVRFLRVEEGAAVYEVGSGRYRFCCRQPGSTFSVDTKEMK